MIDAVESMSTVRMRPWWPVWLIGVTAALVTSFALTFTLVTSIQRADRADHRANASTETDDCAALYAAAITDTTQEARSALNDLVIVIARQSLSPAPPEDVRPRYEAAVAELERTNLIAEAAIDAREQWVADGRPIPCPLNTPEE